MTKIAVIGAGPGGYEAAIRAAQMGAEVVLIEADRPGGTCLNRGCIPTKTLWKNAEIMENIHRKAEFGLLMDECKIDPIRLNERKCEVVKKIVGGVEFLIGSYPNIEYLKGFGSFVDPHKIHVKLNDGSEKDVTADYIIIATGSKPSVPPIAGTDLPNVITSDEFLDLKEIPEELIVVGGGVIGMEFASIYAQFGSKVTVMTNGVLPATDGEIQKRIPSIFKRAGIKIVNKVRASEITQENGKLKVTAKRVDKDKVEEAEGTMVLLATGRKANIDGLEIEKAGVVTERGAVVTDKEFKTNVDHIYAIGDVVYGNVQLAHVASAQAIHVVEKLMGEHPEINLNVVPACTFTLPEVAQVGLTEEEVIAQNIPYVKSKFMFSGNGKAVSLGEADGFVKVLATEDLKRILGIHIIGPHANDLIHEGTVAMANDMGVESIGKMIHAHPTLSEAFMEAIHQLEGKSIHSAPAK